MKKLLTASVLGLCFVSQAATAGLVVNQNSDGDALVNTILGDGITTSNIQVTGAEAAFGTFTGGVSAGIGIESGIMLSSGKVVDAVGPNTVDSKTTSFGTSGSTLLNGLSTSNTRDAALLTFDFESDGGDLFFNYVFASEEYNEFVNTSYNDVFGFFVDGENIALIPGTDEAVSINNVNGGNPLGSNASNPEYFNNNDITDGGPFFDIQYDGFTDAFTAQILGLSAGSHSISLAIADAGDTSYDSTVFIQAKSFSDQETPVDVPTPGSLALLGLALVGLRAASRKKA